MTVHGSTKGRAGWRLLTLGLALALATAALITWGTGDASSDVVTATLAPVADSYVESTSANTNYGTNARIVADANPTRQIFLRFDLTALSGTVQSARLRIHVANVTDSESPSGGTVARVTETPWTETGITYNNRPTVWGATVATVGAVKKNSWVDVAVTSAVTTGGVLTLGIRSTNDDGAYYDSRQTTATPPQLIVTTQTPETSSSSSTSSSTDSSSSSTSSSTDTSSTTDSSSTSTTDTSSTTDPSSTSSTTETSSTTDTSSTSSTTTTTDTSTTTTTTTTLPPPDTSVVNVAAVGDMACTPGSAVTSLACRQLAVSNLIVNDPKNQLFLALGDLQYENGALSGFQSSYEQSYGRIKAKTRPAVGNHEYGTAGASAYFSYFGAAAGAAGKGYYSFDVGNTWHIVALNSNCDVVSCAAGGAQEQWLRADLASTTRPCVIATWHHPRFSSSFSNTPVAPFWNALQTYGAELNLVGHEHSYERFNPQLPTGAANANGVQEIVVGTGGRSLDGFKTPLANSAVRLSTFGVLKLALGDNTYSWQFVDQNGAVKDSGTRACH